MQGIRVAFEQLRQWARTLKREVVALWIAARDPRTPVAACLVAAAVAAYALSPIDLIPDFIPVLGQLDDLLIVPLGIVLAVRMIPPDLMAGFRHQAEARSTRPRSLYAAALIGLIWLAALVVVGALILR